MKTVVQLRNDLCDIFDSVYAQQMEPEEAKVLVYAAGKIIKSAKVELEYSRLRKERPVIAFLGGEKLPADRDADPDETPATLPASRSPWPKVPA